MGALGLLLDPWARPSNQPGPAAYLFVAPPLGMCASVLARAFVGRDRTRSAPPRAIRAFCFAFPLAIVRFRLSQF